MKNRRPSDLLLLVVETPTGNKEERLKLEEIVRNELGTDVRGRPWRVERLFKGSDAPLTRYFRVSGHIDAPPQHFDKAAFGISYKLRDLTGFPVTPDIPSTIYGLPETPAEQPPSTSDVVFESAIFPSEDPLPESSPHDWALKAIHAPDAWNMPPQPGGESKGKGTIIAHPDTGWTDHPDMGLASYDQARDRDILDNDDEALDPLDNIPGIPVYQPGHGTLTSSTLAARLVTSVQGVAPLATVVPIRTMRSVIHIFDSDVARAVQYARDIGAHVVSMSLGGIGFFGLREVIDAAVREGIIVLAAAGNYVPWVTAPASYTNCIAVAATNAVSKPWRYSSRGSKVALSAPGQDIWAPGYDFGGGGPSPVLGQHSGTSFAVAHVAGVAALWLAHHGRGSLLARYGPENLQAAFLHVVRHNGTNKPQNWDSSNMGVGIVDARLVLSAPLPSLAEVQLLLEAMLIQEESPQPESEVAKEAAAAGVGREVEALFPNLSRSQVWKGLSVTFGASDHALIDRVRLFERELVWILSQKRAAWEAFVAAATAGGPAPDLDLEGVEGAEAVVVTSPTASLLGQFASPALARQVG